MSGMAGYCILLCLSDFLLIQYKTRFTADLIGEYRQKYIYAYLNKNRNVTGAELVNNSVNVLEQAEKSYLEMLFSIIKNGFSLVGALIVIFAINRLLFVLILMICWIPLIVTQMLGGYIRKRSMAANDATEKMNAQLYDIQGGYEILNTSETKKHIKEIFDKVNGDMVNQKRRFQFAYGIQNMLSTTVGTTVFLLEAVIAGILGMKGIITIGALMAVMQVSNYILNPIMWIPVYKSSITAVKPLLENLDKEINEKIVEPEEPLEKVESITVSDLKFSYGDKVLFDGAGFTFEAGKKYLLTGPSGCGKSTLLKLLLRQRVGAYEGNIAINGKEICEYRTEDYFKKISYIGQHIFLFNDTVENNILLFEPDRKPELERAINKSQLTGFVRKW